MPTGYTAGVNNGSVKTLKQYAMECVRGMGVCITMRDEGSGAELPECFYPSTDYHDTAIVEAKQKLEWLHGLSESKITRACEKDHEDILIAHDEIVAKHMDIKTRYEAMILLVKEWRVSSELESLKKFMIEQLEQSIEFDCGSIKEPDPMEDPCTWKSIQIISAKHDVRYHTEKRQEEIERVEGRNAYLKEFRECLI